MFINRLKHFFTIIIGIPAVMAIWFGLVYLFIEHTTIDDSIDGIVDKYGMYIVGGILTLILIHSIYKFINWLFIEPLKEHIRNKRMS